MKYIKLKYNNEFFTSKIDIEKKLAVLGFKWLINCEFENADIEIKNNTILWKNGIFYYGTWIYGIWKKGTWVYGTFENGIWESGEWKRGIWVSGIKLT
jgi:hypothetical protein